MAAVYLPISIRDIKPIQNDFNYTLGNAKIESEFQDGSVHSRWKQYTPKDRITMSYIYSQSQYEDFLDFYKTTLQFGTKSFRIVSPLSGEELEIKIIGVPRTVIVGPINRKVTWNAIIELEV